MPGVMMRVRQDDLVTEKFSDRKTTARDVPLGFIFRSVNFSVDCFSLHEKEQFSSLRSQTGRQS